MRIGIIGSPEHSAAADSVAVYARLRYPAAHIVTRLRLGTPFMVLQDSGESILDELRRTFGPLEGKTNGAIESH